MIDLPENDDRQSDVQFEFDAGRWKPCAGTTMQPVVMVSWYAADAYSRWANGVDWRSRDISFLPTEAQWEHASECAFENKELVNAGIHRRGQSYNSAGLSGHFTRFNPNCCKEDVCDNLIALLGNERMDRFGSWIVEHLGHERLDDLALGLALRNRI